MTPLAEGFVADALSGVASVLEIPVHVAALVLLLVLALELGRAVTELWRRHRPGRMPLWAVAREAVAEPHRAAALARTAPTALASRAVEALGFAVGTGDAKRVEDALTEYELGVQRRLDGTRLLVRAAPALGLMGTLIPLAPGLEALGRGDIGALAADLRTAFAATVIGLLVGTVAFALTLVRTRVYTEDLAALERAIAGRLPGTSDPTTGHAAHAGGAAGTPGVAVGSAAGAAQTTGVVPAAHHPVPFAGAPAPAPAAPAPDATQAGA
ncbi:MotA/TolQ/ExbB proton channel family protein [Patulibacter americanus]|uniref:MotA/TolQ/ExbB proton channel family protein n=1 Tax=Patulibacter americanus TaxID=588672 RepID=UPI0003B7976E|nr:MotA/TolQ/ExbB proton channel family protein [Patulibacter americanus]